MNIARSLRSALIGLFLILTLVTTSACGAAPTAERNTLPSGNSYSQLQRGDTASGQNYGNWVVQTAQGLIKDAYVRDNDKLGVVISSDVRPNEVKTLSKSLLQGFQRKFPNRDLSVLMYAPDKKLILTAKYDNSNRQIQYE